MERRQGSRGSSFAALVLALAVWATTGAADTLPYGLSIAPTGDAEIDQAIADSSLLAALADEVPVSAFGLVARAEADFGRFETVLRSFGYYDAWIRIWIAGRPVEDPDLLPALQGATPEAPVPVAVEITPGPLYRIGMARLEGSLPGEARAAFGLRQGDPARARDVLTAGEAVLETLREGGFALAEVPAPEALVDHATRTMEVLYRVEAGPRLALGSIQVIGLERLRERYVLRRLGLMPGEPFSPSRLEAARRDLLAGGVLAWARLTPGTAPDDDGRLPLTLEVAERPRRVVRLAAAYSSDEGLSVSTSWTHRNLFGGAESLTLGADMSRFEGTDLNAPSYFANATLRVPDLWLRDLDLRVDLAAVSENLDAYDREALTAGIALERRFSGRLSGSAGTAFEHARITQDGVTRDYRLLSLPMSLTYDGSDDRLDPRRGLRLTARVTPSKVLEGESSTFVVARGDGSFYLDLAGYGTGQRALGADAGDRADQSRWVLAARLGLGSILGAGTDSVPPDWRFYAGGGGSVRGYPFQSIGPRTASDSPAGGAGLVEAALEVRRRFAGNWGAVAFVDAGAVSENPLPDVGTLAVGVGIGLRYHTPIGPIRADIATPLDRDVGDSPVQLYIGIGQAF